MHFNLVFDTNIDRYSLLHKAGEEDPRAIAAELTGKEAIFLIKKIERRAACAYSFNHVTCAYETILELLGEKCLTQQDPNYTRGEELLKLLNVAVPNNGDLGFPGGNLPPGGGSPVPSIPRVPPGGRGAACNFPGS